MLDTAGNARFSKNLTCSALLCLTQSRRLNTPRRKHTEAVNRFDRLSVSEDLTCPSKAAIDQPLEKAVASENPDKSGQGNVRPVRQTARPFLLSEQNQRQADRGPDDRADHEGEKSGLPTEEGADGCHEFYIAEAHGFLRQDHAFGENFPMMNCLRVEHFVSEMKFFGSQANGNVAIAAVDQFDMPGIDGDGVGFAIKEIFEGNGFIAVNECSFCEDNGGLGRQGQFLFSEEEFAQAQNTVDESS